MSKQQPERDIYTPSRLNREVRLHLESGFSMVWVEGEVSNLARPASGHLYFTLKDDKAQVRCALFRNRNPYGRIRLENGQQIVVGGRISLYEPRGEYQLIADHVEDSGEGRLRREFEILKQKLAAEGLFDAERKRPLPRFPRTIAVVTSPSGAAIRDVVSVITRRYPLVRLVVVPSAVQGEQAPAELRAALARAQALSPDVVLLTRGGGSLEDLWAFNDEGLARDIAACTVPTACAVGHEIDFSIAEFVADQRAATPSAAAELLVPDSRDLVTVVQRGERALQQALSRIRERFEQQLDRAILRLNQAGPRERLREIDQRMESLRNRVRNAIRIEIRHTATRLKGMERRVRVHDPRRMASEAQHRRGGLERRLIRVWQRQIEDRLTDLGKTCARLAHVAPTREIDGLLARLDGQAVRLRNAFDGRVEAARLRFESASKTLNSVSPQRVLERGYSVTVSKATGKVLRDAGQVKIGESVTTQLARGQFESEIKRTD